ncbi:diguanylate cyclase (GGDEF)-like protein [Rhizobium sp. PP-F2F-G48]|uniref:putative bifunctional diguanylate cyclase/phosphodiesterase n=1 Tax=Rhizobium sp. PP-F2F-G48 TaxID=2135651 RepID=UPI0010467CCF|nr:EAL domain-containing protein [Rhizobium sp. PP-F2F-G48]TCM52754.1 diguanylate cyclase (GGDEF)-like protein [Rhizobium sp. PP-F2F-G48]
MTVSPTHGKRRILICDDEAGILDAYRRIFADLVASAGDEEASDYDALSADLFGDEPVAGGIGVIDEIVTCRQGEEAVEAVRAAKAAGQPFGVVFLDVRMPPGIDGVEAARQIRAIEPVINIVIVTGYSDHRPAEIAGVVGTLDRLFYLVKPFDADEVRQMATTLVNRWTSDSRIASELAAQVEALEALNQALRASEASAHRAARRDSLTKLLNRTGLQEQFDLARDRARASGARLALLYLDLDRFKRVNDTYGHGVGDLLICEVARRLSAAVLDEGFVARLGGDEFAIVCETARLEPLLARVLAMAEAPFVTGAHHLPVPFSIGYSRESDGAETDLPELMRQADVALYVAKDAGRGVARAFDPDLDRIFLHDQMMARDLKAAIETEGLCLFYQPLMCIDGKTVTGVEALLRWQHDGYGPISPDIFVPIAEKNGLMGELGDWVLRTAFADARAWPDVTTSINLSVLQFARPDFAATVLTLARDMGVMPDKIEFEITETAMTNDTASFLAQVEVLRLAGFRFALDDFGSGYASIGYLSRLNFHKLKIDRSFVSALTTKPDADRMIRSIVNLGLAMGLTITAEGVEDVVQHDILKAVGCDQLQGFLFHRPCSRGEVEKILNLAGAGRQHAA